ncbi:MAG: hypothetical protein GX807_02065, partial [Erysipelotrichia bacterium]|nr:hypothetical protein [Erysipelotrichia bacterium]
MKKVRKLGAILLGSILAIGVGANIGFSPDHQIANAADVTHSFSPKGFGGYTTNSYASTFYSADVAGGGITVKYEMGVFNGSTGAVRGNKSTPATNYSLRNTTAPSGYYIAKVTLNVTGGTL